MSELRSSQRVVTFGPFRCDLCAGELYSNGVKVRLPEQSFRLLETLLERPGEVVTRQELQERLWPGQAFGEFSDGLNTAVNKLRAALDDEAENPRFIETIPRRGYRFIAPTERALPAGGSSINSLAVLPLENLSQDPEQEYFADGMTDQLITELARTGTVRVISRTSVQCYKRPRKSLPEIARRLNVDAVVEGTVLRCGQRVRITAQLIDAGSEDHLWAESYERSLEDVLKLQGEVAQAIASEVHTRLAHGPMLRPMPARSVAPFAYECYLKGRYFWNKRTEEGILKGIEYFRQAIEADPTYALAYAGLAESYLPLGYWGYLSPGDSFPKAKAWALKALEIDSLLAEAFCVLGGVLFKYERDTGSARKELEQAITLNPNCARTHQVLGELLTSLGEFEAAAEELRLALELDPLSPLLHAVDAQVSYFARRFEEAVQKCRNGLEFEQAFPFAHYMLGVASEELGWFPGAFEHLQKAVETAPRCVWFQAELARAYALSRKKDEARRILRRLEKTREDRYVSGYSIAGVYESLGDTDLALLSLNRAIEERSARIIFLNVDPAFDALRPDPQFQDLLRRAALPARG
jgi:TolB-like protein/Flp pilus assembly protein TadD